MASIIDVTKYGHSPVHHAVVTRDYAGLKKLLSALPKMRDPSEVKNEAASASEETKADTIASIIDRRDVVNRDTALHLAVKLGDETSAEMLMAAGADWSLQNEQGWSALQEAICGREERIAMIIVKHYQPLAWAKWCRRLPRLVATMHRMRDFYMEITFHFESSVIPFISRVAPSDTYKIWKRGANLRADMTLAGFDGFRIQRSDQTILFLGDGSEDGKVPSGSLLMISHKDKEVMNALDGAGAPATEEEVRQEVAAMSKTSIFRPGIDVTQAVLFPQLTWRRQERSEMVGKWKAKVYDMHNVVVSIKSRRVPGAMTDEELFSNGDRENEAESGEDLGDVLTEDERKQLELALKLDSPEESSNNSCSFEEREVTVTDGNGYCKQEKKGWFSGWRKREEGEKRRSSVPPRSSLCVDEKVSDLLGEDDDCASGGGGREIKPGRHSTVETVVRDESHGKASTSEGSSKRKEGSKENEYKKGLRPILWLSERFPLQTKELLPLLDILANKVKAVRRLRELMTTKLPSGTFPVKVAIPVIPTIRVLVTFTKFEELEAIEDEFVTPPSTPTSPVKNSPREEPQASSSSSSSSSSWYQWMKTPSQRPSTSSGGFSNGKGENDQDPFAIPRGYNWITSEEKKKKVQEKNKAKKGKSSQNTK